MQATSTLKAIIESKSPGFFDKFPQWLSTAILRGLAWVVHAGDLQAFFDRHGHKKNEEFIEAVFEYLGFGYGVTEADRQKIPVEGGLICVSNHVLGPLDGLMLLHLIGGVRQDVKIIVNDILAELHNLSDLFLLYDLYATGLQKQKMQAIKQAIAAGQAVIFFPAGEVAKLTWQGIREPTWMTGPVSFARKYDVPILPMYIDARNSRLYYLVTLFYRDFSTFLLSHEMFRKRGTTIPIIIGDLLPPGALTSPHTDLAAQTQRLREHVYRLGNTPIA